MLALDNLALSEKKPSRNPFRTLYHWVLKLSEHPKAPYWMAAISFAESSFFLIPPDVLLLPLCLTNRQRAYHLAATCTLMSVLGGLFGYFIGYAFFDSFGSALLAFYGATNQFHHAQELFQQSGGLVVFTAGFTPIPYKVITISAGVFDYSLPGFIFFSLLSRGARFFLEAFLLRRYGPPAMAFITKHFDKITLIVALFIIAGFVLFRYVL